MKTIFSLFHKNNQKENEKYDITINKVENETTATITNPLNKSNNGFLKRNESIINLANVYFNNNRKKSMNSFSSSSSSIYSSNYNRNNNSEGNGYNKVIIINSSSNNQHIKNKEIIKTNSSKESSFGNLSKSLNGSSLIDTSMTQLSSVTEVSSITINSEIVTPYMISDNQINNSDEDKLNININSKHTKNESSDKENNVKLRFKSLYLSRRISHKIPAKNIECLNNYRRQFRRSNDYSYYTSSDEYPATLYTFRQIHARFPKQYRRFPVESHKIPKFKDNCSINKHFKDTNYKMRRIHHKKNASKSDYVFTLECLNTIITDENTIKSVKKSSELVKSFKNKIVGSNFANEKVNKSLKENKEGKNSFNNDYYDFPKEGTNQFITNNETNFKYERDFINGNIKNTCYSFGGNDMNYESPQHFSNNIDFIDLEKQKQDLQQQLIQQIQQQSRYYQENKFDYSYSCTTLSSYTGDNYSTDSDDEYSIPDLTKNYYETVIVSSNPMSSFTSLSFKKHKDNSVSITASYSSVNNNDIEKLKSLCNNINSTLEQIKVINNIESTSNTPKFNIKEESEKLNSIEHCHSLIVKKEEVPPFYKNNTLTENTTGIHNTSFKLYDSDATESITSSSTISTDSIKDTNYINSLSNYIYYKEPLQKPFYNLIDYS
ncbi:hypothetical protein BCR32DRAFT_329345 [Anaeromyces robustus]|uniref:Uncharacterized protein n=1 Tax=Anaeromyces robustus TaxID=1754192 RepID=A0A1Y1WSF3_9FUNG|nr:hypothetical protein BCR32DRAFT_329345 [Anaeromyces robustus]|eukprot:ORX76471.1 hypothetical protein BCR32DRAFT_329345 [Anaeromyces robustus]